MQKLNQKNDKTIELSCELLTEELRNSLKSKKKKERSADTCNDKNGSKKAKIKLKPVKCWQCEIPIGLVKRDTLGGTYVDGL